MESTHRSGQVGRSTGIARDRNATPGSRTGGDDSAAGFPPTAAIGARLVAGALGAMCVAPRLVWDGSPGPLDSVLAVSLVLPLAIGVVRGRSGPATMARDAIWAASRAGLVSCVLAVFGSLAWPALLWLLAAPFQAWRARPGSSAPLAALISGGAAACLCWAVLPGVPAEAEPVTGQIAALFLILSALADIVAAGLRAPGGVRARPDADGYDATAVLVAGGDLVTWHDRQGDVLRARGAPAGLAGLPPSAFEDAGLFDRVHIPDRPAYLKALSDVANGSPSATVEFRLRAGPGVVSGVASLSAARSRAQTIWVEMRAHALADGPGGAVVAATVRDVSASRRHADERESARIEAVRTNGLKDRFLATVTHELRTPLNAIIGFSELLSADHPFVIGDERRREYATIIRDSGHHLLDVVNTLLDLSKIESGNFQFAPETVDLASLARNCCELMQLKADESFISLAHDVAPDLPAVTADRRACRQIMINLVSNALKFTAPNGTVTLSLRREGDAVLICVSDDGIGIRESDLPRLGDPFFQVGDVHRRACEGTGLGLSVVRGLVGLHGGSLALESGLGAGTSVTVGLPIASAGRPANVLPAILHTRTRRAGYTFDRKSA